jgi:hypothetical protein
MNLPIKFLKQNEEPFLPVTAAEAVMVKHATGVRRLDEVLRMKIEEVVTPAGSGLTSYPVDGGVVITHSNSIDPSVDELKPKLIKYDNRGHLIETSDFGQLKVIVNGNQHVQYDGSTTAYVRLGEDFMDSNGYI